MEARWILFALHEMEGIGWKTILKLITHVADFKQLPMLTVNELQQFGIDAGKAQTIKMQCTEPFMTARLKLYQQAGVELITIFDEHYPQLLKQTSQPPWVLYSKGKLAMLNQPMLAVVGTRNPTSYGKKVAEMLAAGLSEAGICVVSGLARGIDSCAHQGALQGGSGTVAVLGCAINEIYPPENRSLYDHVTEQGLILSEYPIGCATRPGMFPLRNRVIAGLSLGTLVVEAAAQSGSLITADQSLEESRDVFAVPGPITSPKSQGTLTLLKNGAKMVTCVADILEEYEHRITLKPIGDVKLNKEAAALDQDELGIYQLLSTEPTTIDQLLQQSQYNFGHLHSVLLSLLMKKRIEQLPGSAYAILY